MPIPSLPIETVDEIVSHLRAPSSAHLRDAVQDGKAISLACRSWARIGQELRWKDLEIDISNSQSLRVHFYFHPHLARLVSSLRQSVSRYISLRLPASVVEMLNIFASQLPLMANLVKLDIAIPPHLEPRNILSAASQLPRLLELNIVFVGACVWTAELASIFASGFPSLLTYRIAARGLGGPESGLNTLQAPLGLYKDLQNVSLKWTSKSSSPLPLQSIISCLNPATLKTCDLGGSPACELVFGWLTTCSNLEELSVYPSSENFANTLTDLLSSLHLLPSLIRLNFDSLSNSPSVSNHSLSSLISASPAKIKYLSLRTSLFTDWEDFAERKLPARRERCRVVEGLRASSRGGRGRFMIWKEDGEGTSWFRYPGRWSS